MSKATKVQIIYGTKGYKEGNGKFETVVTVKYRDPDWYKEKKADPVIEELNDVLAYTIQRMLEVGADPKSIRLTFSI